MWTKFKGAQFFQLFVSQFDDFFLLIMALFEVIFLWYDAVFLFHSSSFSGCRGLTDCSLRVIGDTCTGLHSLNISNLDKLNDLALQYLADGCRHIQTFKLCRNKFRFLRSALNYLVATWRYICLTSIPEFDRRIVKADWMFVLFSCGCLCCWLFYQNEENSSSRF